MLAKRIIPCLDVTEGRVVKGVNFVNLRDAGDPVEQARIYDAQGADELVLLDFMPFTVGGGVRTIDDVRNLLLAGADKVSINSAAVLTPEILTAGAERFGSQCIVLAVDAKRVSTNSPGSPDLANWEVYINGGRIPTGLDVVEWCMRGVELGAGEILLTSMDGDGTLAGYDIELTRAVAEAVPVPVIASGGAGTLAHFVDVLTEGKADAALAASLFHDQVLEIGAVKSYLTAHGVTVRH